jgi:hypothetical protein
MGYVVKNKTNEVVEFSLMGNPITIGAGEKLNLLTNPISGSLRLLENRGEVTVEFVSDVIMAEELTLTQEVPQPQETPQAPAPEPVKKKRKKTTSN